MVRIHGLSAMACGFNLWSEIWGSAASQGAALLPPMAFVFRLHT